MAERPCKPFIAVADWDIPDGPIGSATGPEHGIQVIPLLTSILYDKDHFVKADEFYPEHFLDSSGNFVRKEAFMPFSAGKRSCAGENLAKMELYLFFTRLLQNFTFKAPPGATLDLTPAVGFTAVPMSYKMCAIPRV
ncbi:unnamed protein product [Ranitomeya imitator]|uniref:Cytochrome P450 n=1 Tax=Ranitomeya imitator TaxID=111125 RepID=A0ABN9L408_9NEOB|nr:unnamed protein product [Ranitomeya imitator]